MKYTSIHEFADLKGSKRRVIHAPGALNSWEVAASRLSSRKAAEIEGFLIGLFEAWIDGQRLHGGWAAPEGDLDRNTKFYAIKRIPVRAYFWYSVIHDNTIVISHYVVKKWNNLRAKDIARVRTNWQAEKAGVRK